MSNEVGPGSAVSSRLGYLFKHAGMRLAQLNEEALAPLGIDARELAVLLLIADNEPASQQQAAQRLGVDRTTMVALLDALEGKGLLSRRPQVGDRRRNVVELTNAGQDTLRRATRASDDAEHALLASLTALDADRLRDLLKTVATRSDNSED
ncbi:MarR family transcriptional regulator [Streptomyces sp. H10-C2]|uniref:MarR family winged helix-turn-helix transcriptional regulator n=1 Tax=unclassified Streptomyces TaxID=2593676 RepID=UPI0024B98FC7|nr:MULTISPECIES: MarR family transcriptional regulator [unclassified Streptomyces]MDJ0346788.1 MarR family transcriptional regulator [Streptomyces sp. PH10-H1]MDJ0374383.1 MarR family transcriptional regulator [Streptomyces sp. H10-C2]